MLLIMTEAGLRKEDEALLNGEPLPKISALVISDEKVTNPSQATALPGNEIQLTALVVDRLSPGTAKIYAEIPPQTETQVRSVGVKLADGTLFACAPYLPENDGFFKGLGFSFALWVLLSRQSDKPIRFEYAPLDVQAVAQRIEQEARVELDIWLNHFLLSTIKHLSGLNAEIYRLTRLTDDTRSQP